MSAGAPGGHAAVSGDAAAVLMGGLIVVEAIRYLALQFSSAAHAGDPAPRAIAHTCSCYGYQPPGGGLPPPEHYRKDVPGSATREQRHDDE